MKKTVICRGKKEYTVKRAYKSPNEYETIRIFEKIGLFKKRELGYIVVNTTDYKNFDFVCCEALDRAIKRDNYHRKED